MVESLCAITIAVRPFSSFSRAVTGAVAKEARRLAGFLELELLEVAYPQQ